jgi:hypothetical protein
MISRTFCWSCSGFVCWFDFAAAITEAEIEAIVFGPLADRIVADAVFLGESAPVADVAHFLFELGGGGAFNFTLGKLAVFGTAIEIAGAGALAALAGNFEGVGATRESADAPFGGFMAEGIDSVLAAAEDFEVVGAIVGAVVIKVADDVARGDLAKDAFGDEALFKPLDDLATGGAVIADIAFWSVVEPGGMFGADLLDDRAGGGVFEIEEGDATAGSVLGHELPLVDR